VLVLAVTRIPQLGLRELLQRATPAATLRLGTLGDLSVSPALVLQLERIFGTEVAWSFRTLYVPGIIPFFVVALATALLFRMSWGDMKQVWTESASRMLRPVLALLGALVFVKLLMAGGERAAVRTIGLALADATGAGWIYVAPLLGALGAFFSGSNTISNLTFAPIQHSIARSIGLDVESVLALQTVGGAMGSMACIHNIVAVCAVLALPRQEGLILRRAALPLLVYAAVTVLAAGVLVLLG
jgi:lactate permease